MIRLYANQAFEEGKLVSLNEDELRYFQRVRRGQGEVCLFNSLGQLAFGKMGQSGFEVEKVEKVVHPMHDISVALAMPDNAVIPDIINGLSELGIKALYFFHGERTQNPKHRQDLPDRWKKISLESMRQCWRPQPLDLAFVDWKNNQFLSGFEGRYFFDEAQDQSFNPRMSVPRGPTLCLIGCEGGWTENERQEAAQRGFEFIHLPTPILKVSTAAIAAATFLVIGKSVLD